MLSPILPREYIRYMNKILPFSEIKNFKPIAHDLRELLVSPINADLSIEFSGTIARYTGEEDSVLANLEEARELCDQGSREQFIVFAGERAVGMSIITNQIETPGDISKDWPNVSGFICNPYRSRGLGRLSLERRMQVVDAEFNGHAWTYVRTGNTPAENIVLGVEFEVTDIVEPGHGQQRVYVYEKS